MEGLVLILLFAGVALVIGSVLGLVSFLQIRDLKRQISRLQQRLEAVSVSNTVPRSNHQRNEPAQSEKPIPDSPKTVSNSQPVAVDRQPNAITTASIVRTTQPTQSSASHAKQSAKTSSVQSTFEFSLENFLASNGLLWLGGLVLALGGIFLAKYSIEAGLFPPMLRIILGSLFGVALVIAAECLIRFPQRFNINTPVISAALASGGVITLYAMAFVAFDFYDYLSASVTFILLATISLATAWLSLRLGPVLAGIGIIGAYVVPALVSTGSNNVLLLLIYLSCVSLSSVWVHQIVRQRWIWVMTVVAHFAWFAVSVVICVDAGTSAGYQHLWPITAFCIVSIYLFTLFPVLGWDLRRVHMAPMPLKLMLQPRQEQAGVVLSLLLFSVYFTLQPFDTQLLVALTAVIFVLLVMPIRHSAFDTWPFVALGLSLWVFLLIPTNYDYADNLFMFSGAYLFIQTVVLIGLAYAIFMHIWRTDRLAYLLLLVCVVIFCYGIAYATSAPDAAQYLYSVFAVELAVIALVFAFFATRVRQSYQKMAYLVVVNSAITLILTMLLSASVLTLALTAQLTLMVILSHRYQLPLPAWLYKVAVTAVMFRLTLAPWLSDYTDESILSVHWTLVIYPLAFVLLLVVYRMLNDDSLKRWFGGALVHLVALFITTESSYLLIGKYPDPFDLSFQQSALLSMNYLIYAVVILWRSNAGSRAKIYLLYAQIMVTLAALMQYHASIALNPFLSVQPIGSYPGLNWLLPLWLAPAVLLTAMARFELVATRLHRLCYGLSTIFAILYLNSIIRMAFNTNITLGIFSVEQAELYTYSIVYLLISVALIMLSRYRQSDGLLKAGFVLLGLVILKAFLIDLSTLTGLLRALSFIGLGLSIVGIGWLFQRMKRDTSHA